MAVLIGKRKHGITGLSLRYGEETLEEYTADREAAALWRAVSLVSHDEILQKDEKIAVRRKRSG